MLSTPQIFFVLFLKWLHQLQKLQKLYSNTCNFYGFMIIHQDYLADSTFNRQDKHICFYQYDANISPVVMDQCRECISDWFYFLTDFFFSPVHWSRGGATLKLNVDLGFWVIRRFERRGPSPDPWGPQLRLDDWLHSLLLLFHFDVPLGQLPPAARSYCTDKIRKERVKGEKKKIYLFIQLLLSLGKWANYAY